MSPSRRVDGNARAMYINASVSTEGFFFSYIDRTRADVGFFDASARLRELNLAGSMSYRNEPGIAEIGNRHLAVGFVTTRGYPLGSR